jgi:outer membrane receptor protein involved in Fe transport
MKNLLILLFFCSFTWVWSQNDILLIIKEKENSEPILNARIELKDGKKFLTNFEGKARITNIQLPAQIIVFAVGFQTDTIEIEQYGTHEIFMRPREKTTQTVIVSASRREQNIEEVPISMEILTPAILMNKGLTSLDQMVDQSPGVYAMDGQVSIRGGGGYSYGAGSRVLLVWNGIPMMSPDIGDAKWGSIPVEQADQIEIMKGASSVLYGSGALNGTIALNEREPSKQGDLKARVQYGLYDGPRREELQWWTRSPMMYMADVYYGKAFKRLGASVGVHGMWNEGYKQGEKENRIRMNGSVYYRFGEHMRTKAGISYNFQYEDIGLFVLWRSGNEALVPLDNTLSNQRSIRLNVDPYLMFFDKKENKHHLRTRYYLVSTGSIGNLYSASKAESYYVDYQFSKKFEQNGALTAGVTSITNVIVAEVFGNHRSQNFAAYSQLDCSIGKVNFTGGLRMEYMQQDDYELDSKFSIGNFDSPIYPIIRAAAHYQPFKLSHVRASYGQGIRFPSVAERFVSTSVGALIIFNNPELRPETGWSGEIGWKQIVPFDNWKASIDVAGFINQYSNMTEFTFGVYNPDSIPLSVNPNDIGYIGNWIGFQAQNAERARITGLEFSFNSQGKIKEVELLTLLGYTYMNPISLNQDSAYRATFSNPDTDILKYRFNHLFKADAQIKWRKYGFGISSRYNSFMSNIDRIFESSIFGQELLPGLKDYREIYDKGVFVFDMRFLYDFTEDFSVNFIVNNLFNAEYVSRPGDMQPPRAFMVQLRYGIQ